MAMTIMKRSMSFLLALVMLFTMVPLDALAAEEETTEVVTEVGKVEELAETTPPDEEIQPQAETAGEVPVTRAQWLQLLVQTFDYSIDGEIVPDNYFPDLSAEAEYYNDVLIAVYYGLVDVLPNSNLRPDEAATREFAAYTLNACMGYLPEAEEYEFSEAASVTYSDDIQVAIERGWFALSGGAFLPEQPITLEEKNLMVADAESYIADIAIDGSHESAYTFKEGVIEITEEVTMDLDAQGLIITIPNLNYSLKEGDKIVVYQGGLAVPYQVVSTAVVGRGMQVRVSDLYFEDAIDTMDVQMEADTDPANFYAAEGAELIFIEEETGEELTQQAVIDAQLGGSQSVYIPKYEAELPLTDGLKVKISVELKKSKLCYDVTIQPLKGKAEASVYLDTDATVTASLNAALKLYDDASPIDVYIGGYEIPGVGGLSINLKLDISGSIQVIQKFHLKLGVKAGVGILLPYKSIIFQVTDRGSALNAEVSAKLYLEAKFGLYGKALPIQGYFFGEVGMKANVRYKSYVDIMGNCVHFGGHLYAVCGARVDFISPFMKESLIAEKEIYNEKNSPVKIAFHYEDGVKVSKCTREDEAVAKETGDPSVIADSGYTTSPGSGYSGSGLASGSSKGQGSSGEPVIIYEYSLDTQNNATITGYSGNVSTLSIPITIDGYPVVAIGANVFKDHTELRNVIIPDCVTRIEYGAFAHCSNLTSVQLPANLEYLGSWVFAHCSALTYIKIPASLTDCYGTSSKTGGIFYGCKKLKTVVLEPGMTVIPQSLFVGADSIESIVIPDSVTSIGNYAFCYAEGLKSITFSQKLTEIGQYAFWGCTALEKIEIPDSVTTIWHYAFWDCTSLAEVKLSENLETISEGAFSGCAALTNIKIPASLTSYQGHCADKNEGVFYGCTNLKNVELEEGIQTVPMGLFVGADSIESIVLPNSVTSIGNYAFNCNQGLKQITLSNSLTEIGQYAFRGCTALEKIEIPDTVKTLWHYAFASCTNLKEVKMSENLKLISPGAFCYCTSLTSIKIPATLTRVNKSSSLFLKASEGVFYGCSNLKNVELEEGLPVIADSLFMGAPAIETLVIPASVTEIEYRAFYSCTGLVNLVIPETVTTMAEYVFEGCTGLQTVTWPSSLPTIPKYTFSECTALTTVNLPDNLEAISGHAFHNCDSLVTFTIPDSVTVLGGGVFYDCNSLTEVPLPPNITVIASMIFRYCNSLKTVTIPEGVTLLDYNCFEGCTSLSSVQIPDSVVTIQNDAFADCDSLTSITIPFGVTTIGNRSFDDCDALVSVDMANSVTSLGTGSFRYCDLLKNVKLSQNLTTIPSDCFNTCAELEEIVIPYFNTKIDANAFNSCPKLTRVVTRGKLSSIASNAFSYPDRVVFYGTPNSYTQTWCESNGYTFNENTAAATSVTVAETALTISTGQTAVLNITIAPADFADDIIFKSSNTGVVTVDENGKLTAVASGTANIKILVGNVSATCKVTVTQAVTSITLNKKTLSLDVPETYQLTATITPADASNKVLTWTSSNEAAATVDQNGLVTAVGNGTAVITATATDGTGISASCTVTVVDPANIPVTSITLDKTSLELEALETWQLTAVVSPGNAANKKLRWTSSDENVATVDENGKVTALAKGTAVITAAATDESGITASCSVTVTNTAHVVTDVTKLESAHNYPDGFSDFWLYTVPDAQELHVTFDPRTELEEDFDFLLIYGAENQLIGSYTGTELAGQTVVVPGDTLKIQLVSDSSGNEWGFKVTEVKAKKPIETIASGWSGTTQWTLMSDGTLTVYGTGNMKNYGYNGGQPWLNKGVDITSVVIEEGVAAIGTGAFRNLTTLKSVTLPEKGLTKIGEAAFYGCTSLKEIEIPETIYTVWLYTFKNCTALEKVKFPKSLIKVDQGAFENCTSLPYIYFPTNVEIIGSWSFKGCTGLIEADMTWTDATKIREGAFKNCSSLTTIHLPVNIQTLGDSCFYGIGATSFTVPETVTSIEAWCFARAYSLKNIYFEGNAPTIGQGAFNKITLTAYYPKSNATWKPAIMQNYGGTVTWKAN